MTPLTQQLEDKKKELLEWDIQYLGTRFTEKLEAEIAILEQAIAEMQKQRQEILEDELKFLNLGKIKIEGKTKDMEFLIRKRIQYLKQQLNQPKTEKENSKQ